ncbi:MAG: type II toxin-antitoxin system RelE/ParE family toxin [Mesorhizobium sp.]
MIIGFRHKGLKILYETGSTKGVRADHAPKLKRILAALDAATKPEEMDFPGYRLHLLQGDLAGHWAVTVNGNWRVTFCFHAADVELVDYLDYH